MGMSSTKSNAQIITEILEVLNTRRLDNLDAYLHDAVVVEYPQSGERFAGRDKVVSMLKAFPNLPTFQINRLQACGDLVVAHLDVDHGGEIWKSAFIYELEDGKMLRETAYFGRYFEPAEWRKPFVER